MPQKFYEGFEGLLKTFWSITRKCENENLSFNFLSSSGIETRKVKNAGKLKIKLIDKTEVYLGPLRRLMMVELFAKVVNN